MGKIDKKNTNIEEKINKFVKESLSERSGDNPFITLGDLPKSAVDAILKLSGIDLTGYKCVIEKSSIIHTWSRHGEQSNDRTPLDYSDFIFIPLIINEFDSIKHGSKTGPNGEKRIIIEKKLPGEIFFVTIQEIRKGRKSVAFISLRKRKTRL
ncbi:MAG: hypothetical protein IKK04_04530 [Bacteroidales bacterium]|nr:hypothetical protein [Bacteroidales bacterium]